MKILTVNPVKCNGCRLCEFGCSLKFTGKFNPAKARIHVVTRDETFHLPVTCSQCNRAYCMEVCPSGAIIKEAATGIVRILSDKCTGCKVCLLACPFGNIAFSSEERIVVKCELCDGEPECVALCFTGALKYTETAIAMRQKQRDLAEKLGIIFEQVAEVVTEEKTAAASTKLYEGHKNHS